MVLVCRLVNVPCRLLENVSSETSTNQFAKFTTNLNEGNLGGRLDSTMANLQSGTKGLSDNMDAVKNSFLLRGYFKKQKKAEAKKQSDLKKAADLKKKKDAKAGIGLLPKDSLTTTPVINVKDSIKQ